MTELQVDIGGGKEVPLEFIPEHTPLKIELRPTEGVTIDVDARWESLFSTYQCRVVLRSHEHGGYSAYAVRMPQVIARGATEEEALQNIAEAFRGMFTTQVPIPWDSIDVTLDEKSQERRILVDMGDDPTNDQTLRLIEESGSLEFWNHPDEDRYTLDDGEPL